LPEVSELSEVRDMLQERVIQWTQEWKQLGIDEGIEKGRK
jgi:tRNA splicing ligase